ncbi:MAG: hypothetical protein CM1200mP18_14540 [Gammaproteobacteria bacterium]|nr:MAG: hypothetical protein CM1200mP18_14540 [Gammaproteobacteria bacterium]
MENRFPPTDYLLRYATAFLPQVFPHQAHLIENTRSIHCCQCPAHLGTGLYDCEGWPGPEFPPLFLMGMRFTLAAVLLIWFLPGFHGGTLKIYSGSP